MAQVSDAGATVTLREITQDTVRDVIAGHEAGQWFTSGPGKKMEHLIEEVTRLAIENGIKLAALEDLLYDSTIQVFSSTEILQKSEEDLTKSFNHALAYYDEHLA